MKKSILVSSLFLAIFLAGCGSQPMISNVSIPGSAKNAETSEMGKNSALKYISNATVDEACATQEKIMLDAKWTIKEPLKKESTYSKTTYTDGKANMVVLCSQTEVSATEKATKVTLTLMNNI